jgi:hypothetical protein
LSPAEMYSTDHSMTQSVTRTPPSIPQQRCGLIEAKRSRPLYNESCVLSALMMLRSCCRIKGGARFTNCVIIRTYAQQRVSQPITAVNAQPQTYAENMGHARLRILRSYGCCLGYGWERSTRGQLSFAMVRMMLPEHGSPETQ